MMLRARALRNGKAIANYLGSSLWSGIKHQVSNVTGNSLWTIGDGNSVNFWLDYWCGDPLATKFNVPSTFHNTLQSKVVDFIMDKQWKLPNNISMAFPYLLNHISKCQIPMEDSPDALIWKHADNGILSSKLAYSFFQAQSNHVPWKDWLWHINILSSITLVLWKYLHNTIAFDENFIKKRFSFPSQCILSKSKEKTLLHLFFSCNYMS